MKNKTTIFLLIFLLYFQHPLFIFSLTVSDLSLEEKVGQLLFVHFNGTIANQEAQDLIQELGVGGIIYYNWANELSSPEKVQNLSRSLQQLAQKNRNSIPLFIAVDQEGGRVNRLNEGFTVFPGNYALGKTGEWEWGEASAWMMGQELRAVGVNFNLAPVVDVYTQLANPAIGIRAFSSDPDKVARWGACTLRGFQKARVIAALKHFPGHGDVKVDSHEAMPMIAKQRGEIDKIELYPFRSLASQADVILTAHLMVPALDPEHCTTFSRKIVTDLLRNQINFQGLIITDSLAMQGILSQCSSLEEVVLKSLDAGHDMVLLGGKQVLDFQAGLEFTTADIRRVHHFLIDAVKQGKLSEDRVNAAVERILALKKKYGLFDFAPLTLEMLKTSIHTPAHSRLAQSIARRALEVPQGNQLLPLKLQSPLLIVAPDCLREAMNQTAWKELGSGTSILYFKGLNPDAKTIKDLVSQARDSATCFYFSYNGWQFEGQRELFQQLRKSAPSLWAIVTRDPLDVNYLTSADGILCTFSPAACSLQAALDIVSSRQLR